MENKIEKVSMSKLTDQEALELIYSEFMKIKPKNNRELYEKSSLPHLMTLQNRFSMKYSDILLKAGVPIELLNISMSTEYYLNKLKVLAEKLGRSPKMNELKEAGISPTIYIYRFGSYKNALEAIGLKPNIRLKEKKSISKNQIIKDYKELSEKLGRPATLNDFNCAKLGYSTHVIKLRLGSFSVLREMAGYEKENRGTARRVYTKEIVLDSLASVYIENNGPLKINQVKSNKDLPSISTIMAVFRTTQFTKIWNEVSIRVLEVLKSRNKLNSNNEKIIAAGKKGESNVTHNLQFLNKKEYIVYNDINIYSDKNKLTQQIDHLIIGPNGIFSIETKYFKGKIVVKNEHTWEKYSYSQYENILNPTQQVIRHENQLKSILDNDTEIHSLIVMGNYHTEVKNANLCNYPIVNANEILQVVQNYPSKIKLNEKKIKGIDQIIKRHIVIEKRCASY